MSTNSFRTKTRELNFTWSGNPNFKFELQNQLPKQTVSRTYEINKTVFDYHPKLGSTEQFAQKQSKYYFQSNLGDHHDSRYLLSQIHDLNKF